MRKAWFLKPHEKDLAVIRYEINKRNYSHDEQFAWSEVAKALKDWTVRFIRAVPVLVYDSI